MPHIAGAEMARVFWTARAKKCERARGQDLLWKSRGGNAKTAPAAQADFPRGISARSSPLRNAYFLAFSHAGRAWVSADGESVCLFISPRQLWPFRLGLASARYT
jgi:hypothetical protein